MQTRARPGDRKWLRHSDICCRCADLFPWTRRRKSLPRFQQRLHLALSQVCARPPSAKPSAAPRRYDLSWTWKTSRCTGCPTRRGTRLQPGEWSRLRSRFRGWQCGVLAGISEELSPVFESAFFPCSCRLGQFSHFARHSGTRGDGGGRSSTSSSQLPLLRLLISGQHQLFDGPRGAEAKLSQLFHCLWKIEVSAEGCL